MASAQEEMGKMTQDMTESIIRFLESYNRSLASKHAAAREYAFAIEMANWKGGNYAEFVDDRFLEPLKEELYHDKIPFREDTMQDGSKVIVIRDCDVEGYMQAKEAAKVICGRYYQEMELEDMAKVFNNWDQMDAKDKDFIVINGMESDFASTLKNKCNDITKGFMVGTEIVGENAMNVAIHAKRAIDLERHEKNVYSRDFGRALLAATLSYYGPNHAKNVQQLHKDAELNEKILTHDGNPPMYITGQDRDADKCVVVKEGEFEVRRLQESLDEKGQKTYEWRLEYSCKRTEADYDQQLATSLNGIFDEVILYDKKDLDAHSQGIFKQQSERPQKTYSEKNRSYNESFVVDRVDTIVKESMENDPRYKDGFWTENEMLEEYKKRTFEVFKGIEINQRPVWMQANEFQTLDADLKELKFDVAEYIHGIEEVMQKQQAEQKKVKEIIEERKKGRGRRKGEQQEEQEQN